MTKLKAQPGYIMPASLTPDRLCFRVSVPKDQASIAAFMGQLAELGYWYNWERDTTHFAIDVSKVWRDIFDEVSQGYETGSFFAGDCGMSFCDEMDTCIPNVRQSATGGLQWHNPATGNWEDIPNSGQDPRTDGTVPPPWTSPPVGESGNCLGAANITEVFKQHNDTSIAQLTIAGGLLAVMGGFVPLLDLVFLPIGLIATLALELAGAYAGYSAGALSAAFTSTVYDQVRCALDCNIEADGTITAIGLSRITSTIEAISATVATIWDAYVQLYGINGLMKQERLAGIVTFDCSACACGWCYTFDFTVDDGGFSTGGYETFGTDGAGRNMGQYSGSAWDTTDMFRSGLYYERAVVIWQHLTTPGTFTRIEVYGSYADGPNPFGGHVFFSNGDDSHGYAPNASGLVFHWDGNQLVTDFGVQLWPNGSVGVQGGSAQLTKLVIFGTGTNPFGADNCP